MTEKTETIKKILRIGRTVLYIVWLLLMLLFTFYSTAFFYMIGEPDTSLYTSVYLAGWIFSVLNIETGLVLLRKYSKILGVFHILLGFFCLILALVLTLLYA